MGIDTTVASDHRSSNDLDHIEIPADLLATPPAYYRFGSTPCAIEDPLAAEDTAVYCVRVRCTGEHGPLIRKDGERRYERSLAIQAIWRPGEPEPPSADEEQPALYDDEDEPTAEATGEWDYPEGEGRRDADDGD